MKKILVGVLMIIIFIMLLVFGINGYVILSSKKHIYNDNSAIKDNYDCILVLGAGIWGDKPSPMLEDRLKEAIQLYENGVAKKIIMSGDHGSDNHDEVNIMKDYAIEKGVPSEDIFMDHAGFSTYESMYRAKEIFEVNKVIIVTQKYHLYRAIYIAEKLGIDAYGKNSDPRKYAGQSYRELREIIARDKDFFSCILKPKPTYLGETIPVNGNGDVTNDKALNEKKEEENQMENNKSNNNIALEEVKKRVKFYAHSLLVGLNNVGIEVLDKEDELVNSFMGIPEDMLLDIDDATIAGWLIGMIHYTDKAYDFDLESFSEREMYSDFFEGIRKLTNNEIDITNVKSDFSNVDETNGTGDVEISFIYKEKEYKFNAAYHYDWFDVNLIFFVNKVLAENSSDKFLFITSDGYQDCIVFYNTENWAEQFRKELPMYGLDGPSF